MGIYLNGQLVIADDLLVTGDFKLLGGGNIETVANNDLTLLPNGTGITIVGDAGSPTFVNTNDDLFINGQLEVAGTSRILGTAVFYTSGARFEDNTALFFGGGSDVRVQYSTAQTAHALIWGLSGDSRSLIFCEKGDIATDFGHALQADPTLFIHSADATDVAQWLSLCHKQTGAAIGSGKGDIEISTVANQTLVLVQSVWDDLRIPLDFGTFGASNPPGLSQFMDNGAGSVGVFAWAFGDAVAGNEEQLWFVAQLPHTYKEGTDIKAHIHWSPAVSGGVDEYVKWGLEYTWQNVDGTFGNTTIITSDATSGATATTSGDTTLLADKHYVTALGTITGTSKTVSSMLVCRIFRNSSDASDDLAQDAFGLEVDFHHEIDTMGSRQEFIK